MERDGDTAGVRQGRQDHEGGEGVGKGEGRAGERVPGHLREGGGGDCAEGWRSRVSDGRRGEQRHSTLCAAGGGEGQGRRERRREGRLWGPRRWVHRGYLDHHHLQPSVPADAGGDGELDALVEMIWGERKTLPFTPRWFLKDYREDRLLSLLKELVKRKVARSYATLVEASGKPVAQFEHTMALDDEGLVILT